jgi:hypothetical protein
MPSPSGFSVVHREAFKIDSSKLSETIPPVDPAVSVKVADATPLCVYPFAVAIALIVVVAVTVIGPE